MLMIYLQMIETPEERCKFEQLYIEYRALMFHIAFDILQNEQDAEDAVHQAFLKVAENMQKVDEAVCAKTKSYLVTIVENRSIDVCRVRSRHPEVEYNPETVGIQVEYTGSYDLAQCFAKLTPKHREILILKYHHGFSNKEIARMLSLTEGNAIKLEQRAKAKLFEICKEEGVL